MHLFTRDDEMSHRGHAGLTTQQSHSVKERGKSEGALRTPAVPPEKVACKISDETSPIIAKDWPTPISNSDRK